MKEEEGNGNEEEIREYLRSEFGIDLGRGKIFRRGKRVYFFNGEDLPLVGLRGLYIGSMEREFRPSMSVVQLAKRGFVEVGEKEAKEWMCGLDLRDKRVSREGEGRAQGGGKSKYVIVKWDKYILGPGVLTKDGRIVNNTPKNRRLPLNKM